MNKRGVVIIGSIVIIVAVGIGIFLSQQKASTPASPNTTNNSANTSADSGSEDLGLCTIVDMATIKSALGSVANGLSGPDNTGVTSLGDGDKGQTCVYPFVKGGSATNAFYTDLAQYSQKSFDDIADFTATSGTPISGVGDKATFQASDNYTGSREFVITAVKGTNVYKFAISQPSSALTFDDTSAEAALTTIARAATLK